jgi:hypothetical protein
MEESKIVDLNGMGMGSVTSGGSFETAGSDAWIGGWKCAHLDRFCVAWGMTHPSTSGGITPRLIFKYNGTKYKFKIITC